MDIAQQRHYLLEIQENLQTGYLEKYIQYSVDVPENASKVGLTFSYHNPLSEGNNKNAVIFISFFDPQGFKGQRMNPGGRGKVTLELWTGINSSSEGAIPGKVMPGKWRVQLDIRALSADTAYELNVYYEERKNVLVPVDLTFPESPVINSNPGWYKGELHAHSTESDGKYPVEEVIKAAVDYGLDFFALTDHTTCSQWHKLSKLLDSKLAIIRSLEITSHVGHANLHGITDWVNVYIDQPGNSANEAATEVHRQGGLFCINHAFSGHLSWRDFNLDWSLVDMEEIYHNLEGSNNASQLALWDHHLSLGLRIVGVAGIDSHNPFEGTHELGQVVTWVYAEELSEKGIIEGIRRGNVYISRGPLFEITAKNDEGQTAGMWESLPRSGSVTLEMKVKWDKPLNLFIFKNGMMLDVLKSMPSDTEWQSNTFVDSNPIANSYYRIEYHDDGVKLPYTGIIWRDYSTMQILSNPIWVERKS